MPRVPVHRLFDAHACHPLRAKDRIDRRARGEGISAMQFTQHQHVCVNPHHAITFNRRRVVVAGRAQQSTHHDHARRTHSAR